MRWLVVIAVCALGLIPVRSFAACTDPVYRQFDFWLGNWRVVNAKGKLVGHDYLSRRLGGCAIYEEFHDAGDPGVGFGITGYDRGRGKWHQDFIDDTGFVLTLDGSLQNGAIVLEGTDYANGIPRLNRGVWTHRGDVVEELWTQSTDRGKTWKTHFHGWFYRI